MIKSPRWERLPEWCLVTTVCRRDEASNLLYSVTQRERSYFRQL